MLVRARVYVRARASVGWWVGVRVRAYMSVHVSPYVHVSSSTILHHEC